MAACRALVAFFISPAGALGSAVVMECFFKRDRAKYMGVWTLLVTIGVPVSPFIFGFVAERVSYRWIYWVLAIVRVFFPLISRMLPYSFVIGQRSAILFVRLLPTRNSLHWWLGWPCSLWIPTGIFEFPSH